MDPFFKKLIATVRGDDGVSSKPSQPSVQGGKYTDAQIQEAVLVEAKIKKEFDSHVVQNSSEKKERNRLTTVFIVHLLEGMDRQIYDCLIDNIKDSGLADLLQDASDVRAAGVDLSNEADYKAFLETKARKLAEIYAPQRL